ncbi:2-(3-amino-3-carboxypropyl)histidine synthase subunit 2-like [Saccostrea echinata]|uniref:2-(3-amino-3-carboxypropyl)histidine synthase subunit 2-like n=1 Tax=Saccostrea echinata TaxID=191078 RepID=UPI002A82EE8F|nr:2-(3-amino-3-carboxypropyl)histidine synthase subunit 2-like [Saccostrea echinata]
MSAFSTADEIVIQRKIDATKLHSSTARSEIEDVYEIPRCARWITSNSYERVALQFPDKIMRDAARVAERLEEETKKKIAILGDTSYGSCCVDEVAAEHFSANSIIHFGQACLSPTNRLPVLYVFGHQEIDVTDCIEKFCSLYSAEDNVVLIYDTEYAYVAESISSQLTPYFKNLTASQLDLSNTGLESFCSENTSSSQENNDLNSSASVSTDSQVSVFRKCGRLFPNLSEQEFNESRKIFYIGEESLTLSNLMMTFNKCTFCCYNPSLKEIVKENVRSNKALMKRFHMVERAKDASIVGIVVGTLGVVNYLNIINRLKDMIKRAGKKSYTFVVGKLNVPKLANFMEIDVFVLVACPENSLLDSSEFYKPVVTPFEMELACNSNLEWDGNYVTSFADLLPGGSSYRELIIPDEEVADVSLVTGKMRNIGVSKDPPETMSSVVLRSQALGVSTIKADSAGEYLSNRSWRGLDQQLGQTPVTDAVEGLFGIAANYTEKPTNKD